MKARAAAASTRVVGAAEQKVSARQDYRQEESADVLPRTWYIPRDHPLRESDRTHVTLSQAVRPWFVLHLFVRE